MTAEAGHTIDMHDAEAMLALCRRLALDAGRAIMSVYRSAIEVETKADDSPVTEADRLAEAIILSGLRKACPGIACVAEEETAAGGTLRRTPDTFMLIDPLDGTREFVARSADFTVNIALVRQGAPVLGVVYAPAHGMLYEGSAAGAAEYDVEDFGCVRRRCIAVRQAPPSPRIVASRSHRTAETDAFIARHPGAGIASVGSSLKFCLLAAGKADLYPRFGRTMEWDTAAGDAVLRAAGGTTLCRDGRPLLYGKREQDDDADFANPWFVATTGRTLPPNAFGSDAVE